MAKFTNTPPEWEATGVEPDDSFKSKGFLAGYKAPATYFNWFWNKVSTSLKEFFDRSAGVIQTENGGEVFNDYEGNVASGKLSHSEGLKTTSSGNYSHSEGHLSTSSGAVTHAEGYNCVSSGEYCHSEGNATTASGVCCHSQGHGTTASGYYAHSEGMNTTAKGNYSHAQNYSTVKAETVVDLSTATNDEIIEAWTNATNKFSLAKTDFCNVSGRNCLALGTGANATGKDCIASGMYATTEGNTNTASGNYSHAEGSENKATGVYSHCENIQNEASGDASHAEGGATKASGNYAHSQGFGTRALGTNSAANGARTTALGAYATSNGFASNIATDIVSDLSVETTNDEIIEAWNTSKFSLAKGIYSKVSGTNCLALNNGAEASGDSTIASGANSTSSGINTVASGSYSEAGNVQCVSKGYAATAHGGKTVAVGDYSVANGLSANIATEVVYDLDKNSVNAIIMEAWDTTKFSLAKGGYSSVDGNNCLALGAGSKADGTHCIASGYNAYAGGYGNKATANGARATGGNSIASGEYSEAGGSTCEASGSCSRAFGYQNKATNSGAVAYGSNSEANGQYSYVNGDYCQANGNYSRATGGRCIAGDTQQGNPVFDGTYAYAHGYQAQAAGFAQAAFGKFNVWSYGSSSSTDNTGTIFLVGCGTGDTARANALRISNEGKCYGQNAFLASGADYAEFYEWLDGNPDNEDRRGCFVTLDGNKIRKANVEDDYILGVISATPCVVGNTYSDMWQGMYLTDVYGERLTEVVEVPETTDEETGVVTPAHTETRFIINPEYDPTKDYVGRDKRQEWAAVGTHGQLVVVDDGTCEVNGYCKVVDGGTVTASETVTDYRVIERVSTNHIRIVIK